MEEPVTQSVEFDVNLPKSRPVSLLAKIVLGVGVLALVGAIVAVVVSRTATPTADPTVKIMPAETMLVMSLNTQTDQLPNYNVVAEAWQGSKEAKQLESALELAIIQAGFTWEDDIQPWLGERVTVGLVDLGGVTQSAATGDTSKTPISRPPFFIVAAQTRDRAKSDAFLANVKKQVEEKAKGAYAVDEEVYRGVSIVYISNFSQYAPNAGAFAAVNDVVVVTLSPADLKKAIDASLDGSNLSTSANYQTTMSALPDQTALAAYVDFNKYMKAVMDLTLGISQQMGQALGNFDGTPEPYIAKQQEQLQKLRETMQAMGGLGVAMTYESTGIRFDTVAQIDLNRLPEAQRKLYEASYTVTANKVFESIPQLAMMAVNGNNPAAYLKPFFDPTQPDPFASLPGMESESFRDKIAEFEKLAGVNFNADLIDLFNGEFAFVAIPKVQTVSDNPNGNGKDLPFEIALMLDSSDATRATSSLDKIVQAMAAQSDGDVKWQSLSGLPYSVLLDSNGKPVLTYGVVDGRLVIGSNSETLLGIENAKQASLADEATFKTAVGVLAGNRAQTGYVNLQPFWIWIRSQAKEGDTGARAVLDYVDHFKWISGGSGVPANGLVRSEMHIGVGK